MSKSPYTILVVDDEIHNLEALERAFRGEYRVLTAQSGAEALQVLEQEEVALIITDQRMPGMTGIELLQRSIQYFPKAIRMILTSYTDADELLEAINTGQVYRYILKPWNPKELKITVKRALESYHLSLELERRMQELAILYDISKSLNSLIEVEEVLRFISLKTRELLKAEASSILLWDKASDELFFPLAGQDGHPNHHRYPARLGIGGWVIREGQPLLVPQVQGDTRFDPQIDGETGMTVSSLLCAPLQSKGRVVGAIEVKNRLDRPFEGQDLRLLSALAGHIATSLENARLYQELVQSKDQLADENIYLRQEVERKYRFDQIIGRNAKMIQIFDLLEKVIDTPTTVLIQGETGTGKEMVARCIHYNSGRKDRRFVAQNCGALPESLLESELFGHRKGSFTGAVADKKGLFEVAHAGTIFLDEIGETSPAMQVRLLRVLEEGEIRPVGDTQTRMVDVRVVAATNRDLQKEVEAGRFREDLYYRLHVFPITLPPLRERRDDIPLLAQHFLKKYAQRMGKQLSGFSSEAMDALQA
ncbi:MAG: sigma 54-interacting transcriptional regulator [Candidatus Tectomicrobia bacterium]|uniref:Sigma 54-interacting transcriptional regulator n=1 Tax=Tectimicrobiota bacterium TaxID=2528274 RepID=A0A932CLC8_UNCTE|nr:sigma 54-interacting transcriptional regulator [Candidatus Tectomicrobia bacterium]